MPFSEAEEEVDRIME